MFFCTGDLRYAPAKIFADQTKEQINKICEAVCVPIERLFIVPGNHDVNRNADGRSEAIRSVHYAQNHTGIYSPAVGEIPEDKMTIIQQGQTEFMQVIADIYSEIPERVSYYGNPSSPHFVIETDKLNILHVDSTIIYMCNKRGQAPLRNIKEETLAVHRDRGN